ncbi:MAG: imidazole glycerol phosphate synthase subunit HisF [Candidatus Omnitrophica bacterium]|nr:imidazole glycerol phosphate synthase subunit HisF [Candidatus Omnitrophota bacterium]
MLAKRIIPCLDVKDGRVVKGVRFLKLRDAGDPVECAKAYEKQEADELVFLDITASYEKRNIIIDIVRRTAENVFMPFTVGGGIRNLSDIRNLLNAGAEKISINTAAVKNPKLIKESAKKFGSQCIVVAIDARRVVDNKRNKKWEVYINGGRTPTGKDAVKWAKEAQRQGAGEILLTSMDFDGTKDGYDVELNRRISEAVNIPIIASGGAGQPRHFKDVLTAGKADAALAASIFHYGEYSVGEIKKYLKREGVNVRL